MRTRRPGTRAERGRGRPALETGWLLLLRLPGGAWLVNTHIEHRCPLAYVSPAATEAAAKDLQTDGLIQEWLTLEVALPTNNQTLDDWDLLPEADREKSRAEAARLARAAPPTVEGYIVLAPSPDRRAWGVVTVGGHPVLFATEEEAEKQRQEREDAGRPAQVWTVVRRQKTPRGTGPRKGH